MDIVSYGLQFKIEFFFLWAIAWTSKINPFPSFPHRDNRWNHFQMTALSIPQPGPRALPTSPRLGQPRPLHTTATADIALPTLPTLPPKALPTLPTLPPKVLPTSRRLSSSPYFLVFYSVRQIMQFHSRHQTCKFELLSLCHSSLLQKTIHH